MVVKIDQALVLDVLLLLCSRQSSMLDDAERQGLGTWHTLGNKFSDDRTYTGRTMWRSAG